MALTVGGDVVVVGIGFPENEIRFCPIGIDISVHGNALASSKVNGWACRGLTGHKIQEDLPACGGDFLSKGFFVQ